MSRRSLVWLMLIAVLYLAYHAVVSSRLGSENDNIINNWMPLELIFYAAAVVVTLRDKGGAFARQAVIFILVIAALLRAMLVPIDPVSTDINRYIWERPGAGCGHQPRTSTFPADPALKDSARRPTSIPRSTARIMRTTIYPPLAADRLLSRHADTTRT